MNIFLDTNTIWRRKFAEAMSRRYPDSLLCEPYRVGTRAAPAQDVPSWRVALPPGWASRLAPISMAYLAKRLKGRTKALAGGADRLFLTSFHYLPILDHVAPSTEIHYYCSDDYRSYSGWGGSANVARERELCRRATCSIFVSEALRRRAIAEYGICEERAITLPNASEHRFLEVLPPPDALVNLPRPIFGAVGMFNGRIDYRFLLDLARSGEVGTLALVGPVGDVGDQRSTVEELAAHPKVRLFGQQPHDSLHRWMAGFDVGVIPYAVGALNHYCSPMRLYDHLAVGHPILATDACDQVSARRDIFIAKPGALGQAVGRAAEAVSHGRRPLLESWDDRAAGFERHRP